MSEEHPPVERTAPDKNRGAWWPLLLGAAITFLGMAWERSFDVGLADEGFLWYGAQRVLEGELPIRDFQAYDPGRYFWSAAWMSLLGDDGIVALRLGNAVLGAITVFIATWTIRSSSDRAGPVDLLLIALILSLWMVPAFKVSDSFAAILQLFALTHVVQRPVTGRYFIGGICWGVAAMIGVNHALYGSMAALLLLLFLRGPGVLRHLAAAFAGALLGYSPVLILHASAPGFTASFVDSIRLLFEYGRTNNELSFPSLLGLLGAARNGYLLAARETLWATLFVCTPIFWLWMAWQLRRAERIAAKPIIAAALFLSLPYAHYAYSRADAVHIAVSILPLLAPLLALLVEAPVARRRLIFGPLLISSLILTASDHHGYWYLRGSLTDTVTVGRDRLLVTWHLAAQVRAVQKVAEAAGPSQFFAGPYFPGAYAVGRRKSPLWEIFMIFPSSPARQQAEIERLRSANIRHALISAERADNRPDLGLERTHPLISAYLRRCLPKREQVPAQPLLTILAADSATCLSASPGGSSRLLP